MKHGPIALIDENMPVVLVATKARLRPRWSRTPRRPARARDRDRGGRRGEQDVERSRTRSIRVPYQREPMSALLATIPPQMLAYHVRHPEGTTSTSRATSRSR